jgi:hypothetical protein
VDEKVVQGANFIYKESPVFQALQFGEEEMGILWADPVSGLVKATTQVIGNGWTISSGQDRKHQAKLYSDVAKRGPGYSAAQLFRTTGEGLAYLALGKYEALHLFDREFFYPYPEIWNSAIEDGPSICLQLPTEHFLAATQNELRFFRGDDPANVIESYRKAISFLQDRSTISYVIDASINPWCRYGVGANGTEVQTTP